LGAADGNTLQAFVDGKYGPVKNCPSGGQWQATLVEANPRFTDPLKRLEVLYPGVVYAAASTAAYMCEASTTFYLDTQNHDQNYWGSSMSENHVDTQASGHQAVTVPTLNVLKLLYESTIAQDYVILKMDIEGAEWDVLPCLANSQMAGLIDRLLVEVHPESWGNVGTTQATLDTALNTLRAKGVDIPNAYHSETF
jgi:FkbM family methyltransferase